MTQRNAMQFLRIQDVVNKVTIKKSEIWERVKKGTFPNPISLSPRVTVWDNADVEDWMKSQKNESNQSKESLQVNLSSSS